MFRLARKLVRRGGGGGWWEKFFNFPYADLQSTDNYNFQGDDTLVQPQLRGVGWGMNDEASDDKNFPTMRPKKELIFILPSILMNFSQV